MTTRRPPLHVLSILDAKVVTGPARGLVQLARYLPDDVRLHIALLRPANSGPLPPLAELAGDGKLTVWPLEERGAYDPGVVFRALALARRLGAGVVQSHSYKPHLIALALRRLHGAPWLAFHHGWTAENLKVKLYHGIDRLTLPRADRVVAVSRSIEALALRVGCRPERTVMIPNAVDAADLRSTTTRAEARAQLGLPPDALVVTAVGRLSPEKGQDVLLEAFARIASAVPAMELALAGDGPEHDRLAARARAAGLADRVHFLGHQRDVVRVYTATDVLALPSRSEGMPNALLEAMCVGVPAVAANVGGVTEIATDGETAWVVPPNDPAALGAALAHAARDADARAQRARAASALVAATRVPSRRVAQFLALYDSVLPPAHRHPASDAADARTSHAALET